METPDLSTEIRRFEVGRVYWLARAKFVKIVGVSSDNKKIYYKSCERNGDSFGDVMVSDIGVRREYSSESDAYSIDYEYFVSSSHRMVLSLNEVA